MLWTKRTTNEIKKRWQDRRRRTNEKIAHNKTSAYKSGGGGVVEEMPLTNIVQGTFLHAQTFSASGPWCSLAWWTYQLWGTAEAQLKRLALSV